jgi:hypothetical protein
MKNIFLFIILSSVIVFTARAEKCELDMDSVVVKGETEVPMYNDVKKKTELMRVNYKKFTSPFPDFVQLHIKIKGNCKGIAITSVKVYREMGPRDWVDKKNKSAHEDNHAAHVKPKRALNWEMKPYASLSPQFEKALPYIILRQIPAEDPLDDHKDEEHVWSLRYDVEYSIGKKSEVKGFLMEAPLMH